MRLVHSPEKNNDRVLEQRIGMRSPTREYPIVYNCWAMNGQPVVPCSDMTSVFPNVVHVVAEEASVLAITRQAHLIEPEVD
jgi:hypothetical protein